MQTGNEAGTLLTWASSPSSAILNKFLPSDSTLIYEMSLAGFKRIVSWRTILVPSTLDSSMATLQSALNTLGVVCLLDPTDVNQVQMNLEVRLSKI